MEWTKTQNTEADQVQFYGILNNKIKGCTGLQRMNAGRGQTSSNKQINPKGSWQETKKTRYCWRRAGTLDEDTDTH